MKKGKKIEKDDAVGGSGKADDTGTFRITGDMIGANKEGIDAIRLLQMVAGGIATIVVGWFVLNRILHVI